MSTTWFISDTHFYHSTIIRCCNRPWFTEKDAKGTPVVLPKDTEQMNADMIKCWNQTVSPDDVVWHLGDFAREDTSICMIRDIVSQLHGKINFIMGNHDVMSVKKYRQCGFEHVYDRPILFDNTFILSHEPKGYQENTGIYSNIFGHVHIDSRFKTFTANSACVCVERHNYKPVSFDKIREEISRQRE